MTIGVLFALVAALTPAISASAANGPTAPPGSPTKVAATIGTLAATVSWTPSGQPASSFTATSNPGGISATVDGTATTATVSGLGFGMSYTFSVTGSNSLGTGPASAPSNPVTPDPPGGPYHQGFAIPLVNRDISAGSPVATNLGDDPVHLPGLSAVVLNMTVGQASAATSVQVVVNQHVVQTIWAVPGQVESSLVVVAVPAQLTQAAIQVTSGSAHVQIDFVGYFTVPKTLRDHSGLLEMVTPATLLNTSVAAGSTTNIPVLGQGDIPSAHVAEVLVNVTATSSAAAGSFALLPAGGFATGTTTLGFAAGQTTANRAIVPVPAGGSISLIDKGAAAGVRIDILGWFTDATDSTAIGSLYNAIAPIRLVDTASHGGPLAAGGSVSFPVAGQGGAPANTSTGPPTSALFQVTAVAPAGAGSISFSGVSVIDFGAGQTVSGLDLVHLAGDGSTSLTLTGAASNVTVDLVAYFSGDMIVPGNLKVLSPSLLSTITNLGTDLSITFAPGTQVSPPILLNDVINAGYSAATPSGFLRRVLSISHQPDGSTVLGTRYALITEALTAFSIEWAMPPSGGTHGAFAGSLGRTSSTVATVVPVASTTPFPPPIGTSIDPNYSSIAAAAPPVGLRVDLGPLGLGNGSELDISDLELQALPHFKMWGNPFLGQKVHMSVGFSVGVRAAIQLQILGKLTLIKDHTLLDLFFAVGPPIFLVIFPLIIEFQPGIEARLAINLDLDAGVVFGLNVDRYGAVSGGYDGTNWFVDQPVYKDYLTLAQTFTFRFSTQAQAELDLHLIPSLAFYGNVANIGVEVTPFVRLTVDPLAPFWWDVTLGVCRAFVADLHLLITNKPFRLLPVCLDLLAFHAPGRKLNVTILPASATVARSATTHFRAGVAGGTHGVTWSIDEGAKGGSLSNATLTDVDYKAPTVPGTYHLSAASNDDSSSIGTATITVPADPPGAPRGVTAAVAGPTSATVSWTAPSSDGGSPITAYHVVVSPGGLIIDTAGNVLSATVPNLNPGSTYTFLVTATNKAFLIGPPSPPSAPLTMPAIAPWPPDGVTAQPALGSAVVSWTAPAYDGGAPPITAYHVLVSPGGAQIDTAGDVLSVTVPSLTAGGIYTFTVTATNQAGLTSAPSLPSAPITIGGVVGPGPPTAVSAVALNVTTVQGSAVVSWTAPTIDGGSPITAYHVLVSLAGGQVDIGLGIDTGNTLSVTVPNLNAGSTYTFQVTASNQAGTSAPSVASAPLTIPIPDIVIVTPANFDYGLVPAGQTSVQTFTLHASSTADISITRILFDSGRPADFTVQADHCTGVTVPASGTCTFDVLYTTRAQGFSTTIVLVNYANATNPLLVVSAFVRGHSPLPLVSNFEPVSGAQMLDLQHGWAMDLHGLLATVDGGKTWTRQLAPAGTKFSGNFRFADASHGMALGCVLITFCNDTNILGTSDGGTTWTLLGTIPTLEGRDISVADATHAWVAGAQDGFAGPPTWATIDGGLTWNRQVLPDPTQTTCATVGGLVSSEVEGVRFIDPLHGWAMGSSECQQSGTLAVLSQMTIAWSTSDGGATWTAHDTGLNTFFFFANWQLEGLSATQMRVLVTNIAPPILLTTNDGGATFSQLPLPGPPTDLSFWDANNAVLITNNGIAWTSSDGGLTWNTTPAAPTKYVPTLNNDPALYRLVEAVDAFHWWAFGQIVYLDGDPVRGVIEATADAGSSWLAQLIGALN